MAYYRQIYTAFWMDNYIGRLNSDEKLLFLYLLTNQKTNQCGIFEFTLRDASYHTGISVKKLKAILKKFELDEKIRFSESCEELMVSNWLKYNLTYKSATTRKRINKELKNLKCTDFVEAFYEECLEKCKDDVLALIEMFKGVKCLEDKVSQLVEPDIEDQEDLKELLIAMDSDSEPDQGGSSPGSTAASLEYEMLRAYKETFDCFPSEEDSETMRSLCRQYGKDWVSKALAVGKDRQARSLNFILTILENWNCQGFANGVN